MTPPQIAMKQAKYGIHRDTDLTYDEAVERVTAELKEEGFGILTEINVSETLKKKIDVDFPKYVILGACNPPLAHQALSAEPDIGLLLPCNVVVYEGAGGKAGVSAMNPTVAFDRLVESKEVHPLAEDVEGRLTRALDRVAKAKA